MKSIARIMLAALALSTTAAIADEYPSHPVRIINAMAAGGLSDRAIRLISDSLAKQFGQPVVIENRSGAGGIIGTEAAFRSPADGYTLLVSMSSTFSIIPAVKKASYDPFKDFVPLGGIFYAPQALVVRSQSPLNSVRELVAYAKANPGKLSFASAGNGTSTHMSILLLEREAGIKVIHVPFRSGGQTVASLLGGQVDAVFSDISALIPHIQSGALKALAVTAPKRWPLLPDVTTMAENGLPGVATINWFGLHALAGTPPAILERLKSAVRAAQLDPAYQAALAKAGMSTGTIGAEAFGEMVRQEAERMAPVVRESGITFN